MNTQRHFKRDGAIDFPRCIAYLESGRLCNAPATVVDRQRGGMVCEAHRPSKQEPGVSKKFSRASSGGLSAGRIRRRAGQSERSGTVQGPSTHVFVL